MPVGTRITFNNYVEPEPVTREWAIGTALKFLQDEAGMVRTVLKINVAFA